MPRHGPTTPTVIAIALSGSLLCLSACMPPRAFDARTKPVEDGPTYSAVPPGIDYYTEEAAQARAAAAKDPLDVSDDGPIAPVETSVSATWLDAQRTRVALEITRPRFFNLDAATVEKGSFTPMQLADALGAYLTRHTSVCRETGCASVVAVTVAAVTAEGSDEMASDFGKDAYVISSKVRYTQPKDGLCTLSPSASQEGRVTYLAPRVTMRYEIGLNGETGDGTTFGVAFPGGTDAFEAEAGLAVINGAGNIVCRGAWSGGSPPDELIQAISVDVAEPDPSLLAETSTTGMTASSTAAMALAGSSTAALAAPATEEPVPAETMPAETEAAPAEEAPAPAEAPEAVEVPAVPAEPESEAAPAEEAPAPAEAPEAVEVPAVPAEPESAEPAEAAPETAQVAPAAEIPAEVAAAVPAEEAPPVAEAPAEVAAAAPAEVAAAAPAEEAAAPAEEAPPVAEAPAEVAAAAPAEVAAAAPAEEAAAPAEVAAAAPAEEAAAPAEVAAAAPAEEAAAPAEEAAAAAAAVAAAAIATTASPTCPAKPTAASTTYAPTYGFVAMARGGREVTFSITRPRIFNVDRVALEEGQPAAGMDAFRGRGEGLDKAMGEFAKYLAAGDNLQFRDANGTYVGVKSVTVESVKAAPGASDSGECLQNSVVSLKATESGSCVKLERAGEVIYPAAEIFSPNVVVTLAANLEYPLSARPSHVALTYPGLFGAGGKFAGLNVGVPLVAEAGRRTGRKTSICAGSDIQASVRALLP